MTNELARNDDSGGREFLTAAEKLAEKIEGEAQFEVISTIASRYAKLKLVEDAVLLAETISDPYTQDQTYADIAAHSIAAGTSDYASALLEMIDEPGVRSLAIEEIAVRYAELGAFDRSLELASSLDDADPTLSRLALVEDTFSVGSVELALSITTPDLRASTLGQLATKALRADRKSEAAELLVEALRAAEEIDFSQNRIYALIGIASVYEEMADIDRALEILSRSLELCKSFEGELAWGLSASFPRGEALAQIVGGFARLGKFEQADLAAEQIEDPFQFAHASTKEAIEYSKAGQNSQALSLLSEALELALEEPVYGGHGMLMRDSLLKEMVRGFVIVGHLEQGLRIAEELSSEAERYIALEQVGRECARAGNSRGIFKVAKSIKNNYSLASYWLAITDALKGSVETDLTNKTLFEAMKSATMIEDNYEKASSLIEVAYRFELTHNPSKASELFVLALGTINKLEENHKKAILLLRIDERFRELDRKPSAEERQLLAQIGI